MIKILLNGWTMDFSVSGQYVDYEAESNDGMRGGYSRTVYTVTEYTFKNERKENGHYAYDLTVIQRDRWSSRDLTATKESFEQNFSVIYNDLCSRGLSILNYPAYVQVKTEFSTWMMSDSFRTADDEDAVVVDFSGRAHLAKADDDLITADHMLELAQEKGTDSKKLTIARALGDCQMANRTFKVAVDSIPCELSGSRYFALKKVQIGELLASGRVSMADVCSFLVEVVDLARRGSKESHRLSLTAAELEQIAPHLPEGYAADIVQHCWQTSDNLDLFRKYCPEKIYWPEVAAEDFRDSDLDLIAQKRAFVMTEAMWKFVEHCMENPELERKVVDHARELCSGDYARLFKNLHAAKPIEAFRSILYAEAKASVVEVETAEALTLNACEGLNRQDYEAAVVVTRNLRLVYGDDREKAAAFLLKVGVLSGTGEDELVEFLEGKIDGVRIDRFSSILRQAYQELNFAPGLAWVKTEEERRAAEKHRIATERAESNEAVVKFVRQSGKTAVCVVAASRFLCDGSDRSKISRPDGEEIGYLLDTEQRVLLVDGREHKYLIDIARAKNPRGGILHIDVMDCDAGYIIGKKGANLEKVAQRLREMGCDVRNIRVHKQVS